MNLTDSNEYFTETKQFSQPVELPSNPAHIRTQVCRKIKKLSCFLSDHSGKAWVSRAMGMVKSTQIHGN